MKYYDYIKYASKTILKAKLFSCFIALYNILSLTKFVPSFYPYNVYSSNLFLWSNIYILVCTGNDKVIL